jgi:uncharacterized protein
VKIVLKDIPETGPITLEDVVEPAALDLADETIVLCQPVQVRVRVSKRVDTVSVEALISTALSLDCARCLKKYTTLLKKTVHLTYEIKPTDMNIDLDKDLREEIILDFPFKALCKDDCLGLCPTCGEDLNKGECKCQVKP